MKRSQMYFIKTWITPRNIT